MPSGKKDPIKGLGQKTGITNATREVLKIAGYDDAEQASPEEIEFAKEKLRQANAAHAARQQLYMERKKKREAEAKKKSAGKNQEVLRELMRRELARRSLLRYTQFTVANYQAGWVHALMASALEQFIQEVLAGKSPRLALFLPPRTGKSEKASKKFPEWTLGHYPELEFIGCSYSADLPIGFSRAIRDMLETPEYGHIFTETKIDQSNRNVEGWRTTQGGGYKPAGVGGGITGKGADIGIIDDPFKDAEEADSETIRQKVWDWYGSTFYTRLSPRSGLININTRWHDDDLSGRLLRQMKEGIEEITDMAGYLIEQGTTEREIDRMLQAMEDEIDRWKVLSFPAIAEEDEFITPDNRLVHEPEPEAKLVRKKGMALHPQRFPLSRLKKIKRTLQPRHWSALYQQNPVPDEGMIFRKDMMRYQPHTADFRGLPVVIAWDLAIGEKQTNDYTVGTAACLDYTGRLHPLNQVRGRLDTYEICNAMIAMHRLYSDGASQVVTGIEQGQLQLAIMPHLIRRMEEEKVTLTFDEDLKPLTDKVGRARPLQGLMQQGMVVFPKDQPWVETTTEEMLRFPGGLHDDCVDSMAWVARMAMRVARPTRPQVKNNLQSWKDRLPEIMREGAGGHTHMSF